ncbi:MAG: HD domain-containing protein [Acidobacteriia bacterium]|nr:HD domain-containing protein [Terriglobia bacterium]
MTNSITKPSIVASQALAELGPVIAGECNLQQTATAALEVVMSCAQAKTGALFCIQERPTMLASVASKGFAFFPQTAVFPLLPKHLHALSHAEGPQRLTGDRRDLFLSSNGNISNIWFRCLVPLRVQGRLVGALMLGDREGASDYPPEILHQIGEIAPFIAVAINNHQLMTTLHERTAENLRLIASVHSFWDDALEAFATTIDVKDPHQRGHSLRVGHYSAGIGEALGMGATEVTELRAAGFLHDIGKVTVDKHIFSKTSSLAPNEVREMNDHTVAGHQIVSNVQFPWHGIPEVVRSHHERVDGSGYPDKLRGNEVSLPVKIVAVADTFDAMLSDRSYRKKMSLGECAAQLSWLAPSKLDADVVHALLIQLRRDASHLSTVPRPWATEEKTRKQFLDPEIPCNISPTDIDNLVSEMNRRLNRGRAFVT